MARSESALANAEAYNSASGGEDGDLARAGNDTIDAGECNNSVAGEAMAVGVTADAYGNNYAGEYGAAGNDDITVGDGDDTISGGAQARGSEWANAAQYNTAEDGGLAGNDTINAGTGSDVIAGDAQAISSGGVATAYGINTAGDG